VPEHRESAERRITEAEEELARARAELDALDRGEWPVREIHDESPYHDA
jgi:hypothetical protein